MNIEFIMNKYDDLLAASQKLNKQNDELVKSIVVLKLENCKIANEFQSPDADSEKSIEENESKNGSEDEIEREDERRGREVGLGLASIEKNIRMVKVYEEYDSQGEEEEEDLNRKMVLVSKSLMVQIKYRIDDLPEVASFATAVLDTYEMRPLKNVTD
ncbi:unnamed protein product [Prunus brigantina]